MKKSTFKQYILPHIIAYALFMGIVISFFSPIFFEGKKLFQGDIPHHEGIAKELIDYRKKTGQEALWTHAVFSGMPAYLIDTKYQEPLNSMIRSFIGAYLPSHVGYIFAAMLSCYVLLLAMGIGPYVSMAGGIAYGLSTFTLISIAIGHDGKVAAMAYMPLVLAGVQVAYRRNRWWGVLLTTLALSLEISATHPQITYYLAIMVGMYGCSQLVVAIRNNRLRSFVYTSGLLLVAVLVAVGANWGRLWNICEYGKYSIRGQSELVAPDAHPADGLDKAYAFRWSLGKAETMTLLIPNFYGGSSHEQLNESSEIAQILKRQNFSQQQIKSFLQHTPTYRGEQPFTEGPMYLGAIICFLFVVGLWSIKKQDRYWLLAGTIVAILLAWGSNFAVFNDFMYQYLPGYNKFRAVTTSIVIAQLTSILSVCLVLQQIIQEGITPALRKGLYGAWAIIGLMLTFMLAAWLDYTSAHDASLPGWLVEALQIDRKRMLQQDTLRSLAFISAASLVIWMYGRKKLRTSGLVILLIGLIGIDFYGIGKRYVRDISYQTQSQIEAREATPARQYILQDTTWGYRVLNLNHPFTDGRTSYYHHAVGGYHGAKLRRYQDLIEYALSREWHQVYNYLQGHTKDWPKLPVLDMLNTRYFMYAPERSGVMANPNALGNAWFVETIYPVGSPWDEIEAIQNFDPQRVAVVDTTKFHVPFPTISLGSGRIHLLVYEPNCLQYEAEVSADGLAVFSEIYYEKGWQAWIDDRPVNPIRVNYVLRALSIPAGKHMITFKFTPYSYVIGNQVMLVFNMVLLILVIIAGGYKILELFRNHRLEFSKFVSTYVSGLQP